MICCMSGACNSMFLNLQPVFRYSGRDSELEEFRDQMELWPAVWPPPNEPRCGYIGTLCQGGYTFSVCTAWFSGFLAACS